MQKSKNAFTMIELIFVIVILGVLAAVAIPKFGSIKRQADIASGRAEVATIRSAIVNERQTQLVRGVNTWIPSLSSNLTTLFTGDGTRRLLMYGIKAGSWKVNGAAANANYTLTVGTVTTSFMYDKNTGIFSCIEGIGDCDALVN